MERLHRIFSGAGGMGHPPTDSPLLDSSEQVYISSLPLLKMLKHGRAGVPMEVMGLMLGEFVYEYTVRIVDVFAMPQSGTGVSVDAVDHVFQTNMLDMLKQTGRRQTPDTKLSFYFFFSNACFENPHLGKPSPVLNLSSLPQKRIELFLKNT